MNHKTFKFDFDDLKLRSSLIEGAMGYREGEDRGLVEGMIEELLAEARGICNIKAEYILFDEVHFENELKSLEINNVRFGIKKIVFGQLKKSDSVAVFLCTAGKEIGHRSREAMRERDLLKGYIYDVIGTEIVEAAADIMQDDLEQTMAGAGMKITNRYSPGYCGWDVVEQHKLFSLIPGNYCGIGLTASALMDPVKSVSGFIGVGKNVKYNPYTCKICDQNDCIYRSVRDRMKH